MTNSNLPINSQPITSITRPMTNMGNQIVQTQYGQAFMVPSYSTLINSTQEQTCTQTTSSPNTMHSDQTSSGTSTTSSSAKPEIKTTESITQPSSVLSPDNQPNAPISTPNIELPQPNSSEAETLNNLTSENFCK